MLKRLKDKKYHSKHPVPLVFVFFFSLSAKYSAIILDPIDVEFVVYQLRLGNLWSQALYILVSSIFSGDLYLLQRDIHLIADET